MKSVLVSLALFLFFSGIFIIGFYFQYDSFSTISTHEFKASFEVGFIGVLYSWLFFN